MIDGHSSSGADEESEGVSEASDGDSEHDSEDDPEILPAQTSESSEEDPAASESEEPVQSRETSESPSIQRADSDTCQLSSEDAADDCQEDSSEASDANRDSELDVDSQSSSDGASDSEPGAALSPLQDGCEGLTAADLDEEAAAAAGLDFDEGDSAVNSDESASLQPSSTDEAVESEAGLGKPEAAQITSRLSAGSPYQGQGPPDLHNTLFGTQNVGGSVGGLSIPALMRHESQDTSSNDAPQHLEDGLLPIAGSNRSNSRAGSEQGAGDGCEQGGNQKEGVLSSSLKSFACLFTLPNFFVDFSPHAARSPKSSLRKQS